MPYLQKWTGFVTHSALTAGGIVSGGLSANLSTMAANDETHLMAFLFSPSALRQMEPRMADNHLDTYAESPARAAFSAGQVKRWREENMQDKQKLSFFQQAARASWMLPLATIVTRRASPATQRSEVRGRRSEISPAL